jgi:hypothetical protein
MLIRATRTSTRAARAALFHEDRHASRRSRQRSWKRHCPNHEVLILQRGGRAAMSGYVRKKCVVKGCGKRQRRKGFRANGPRWGRTCDAHHRRATLASRKRVPNQTCERCGWDKAPCDRHRLDPAKGYVEGNVIVLCPNCHRLEETRRRLDEQAATTDGGTSSQSMPNTEIMTASD